MTAKEYLRQIKDLDSKASDYRRYCECCSRDISLLASPKLNTDKVQSFGSGTGFTKAIEKLVDIQAEACRKIDEYTSERDRIINQIHELPYPYDAVLYRRYVEYKDFETIAEELRYSYSGITHVHGEALRIFKLKLETENIKRNA